MGNVLQLYDQDRMLNVVAVKSMCLECETKKNPESFDRGGFQPSPSACRSNGLQRTHLRPKKNEIDINKCLTLLGSFISSTLLV